MYNVSILSCLQSQELHVVESLYPLTAVVLVVMIKWTLCINVCVQQIYRKESRMQLIMSVGGIVIKLSFLFAVFKYLVVDRFQWNFNVLTA
jgi:hypothetical protein